METRKPILVSWGHLLQLLYSRTPKKSRERNSSHYRKVLFKLGLKRYSVPYSRIYFYDVASLPWDANKVDLEDFVRNRHKYMYVSDWLRHYKLNISRWTLWRLRQKKILPYIRVEGTRTLCFVPADFDIRKEALKAIKDTWEEFNQSLLRLAQGSVHAIVFPHWKKYRRRSVRAVLRYFIAQQGRLLKVGTRYGVLVSMLDYTLQDLLEREGGKLENLVYFIPTRSEQTLFLNCLRKGQVTIVRPEEMEVPTKDLISVLLPLRQ